MKILLEALLMLLYGSLQDFQEMAQESPQGWKARCAQDSSHDLDHSIVSRSQS